LSVDPVTFGQTGDPAYFNRYSYTANDPINLIDANGMCFNVPGSGCSYKDFFKSAANTVVKTVNWTLEEIATPHQGKGLGTNIVDDIPLPFPDVRGDAQAAMDIGAVVAGAATGHKVGLGKQVPTVKPKITTPYARPNNATTPAQRAAVQGKPCTECSAIDPVQRANHTPPLVQEYYSTGTIDTARMRSVDAVTPHCAGCSTAEGGRMSAFSKAKKKELGLD